MVLFSSSSPSPRKHGGGGVASRRRNTSAFTVLFLVLSHNVWSTLQCLSTAPYSKSRPLLDTPSDNQDADESDNYKTNKAASLFPNDEFYDGRDNGEQAGGYSRFEKKGGQTQLSPQPATEEEKRLCSFRLMDAVLTYCGANNFYEPEESSLSQILGISHKRSAREAMQRRLTRSLADECCKEPCNENTYRKFCKDRSRIPVPTKTQVSSVVVVAPEQAEQLESEEKEIVHVVVPEAPRQPTETGVQLEPPSVPEEPAEPVVYNSLFHLLNFLHRQFGHKNSPRTTSSSSREEAAGSSPHVNTNYNEGNQQMRTHTDSDRDLPLPQARIQSQQQNRHHNSHSQFHSSQQQQQRQMEMVQPGEFQNYRPTEYQRYQGNPYQAPAEMETGESNVNRGATATGVSFNTNTATASSSNRHAGRHHKIATSTNAGGGTNTFERSSNNNVQYPVVTKNHLRHHQGKGQQRKVSNNVLTSTIAPDVTIIRLGSLTDDDTPYRKWK